jgi:hypothetical protein
MSEAEYPESVAVPIGIISRNVTFDEVNAAVNEYSVAVTTVWVAVNGAGRPVTIID